MKKALLFTLLLAGCNSYEPQWLKAQNMTIAPKEDNASQIVLKCDALGFRRESDGHRLCIMRGIDRLGLLATEAPIPQSAPIQILPYPYPPLAPRYAVPVVPVR